MRPEMCTTISNGSKFVLIANGLNSWLLWLRRWLPQSRNITLNQQPSWRLPSLWRSQQPNRLTSLQMATLFLCQVLPKKVKDSKPRIFLCICMSDRVATPCYGNLLSSIFHRWFWTVRGIGWFNQMTCPWVSQDITKMLFAMFLHPIRHVLNHHFWTSIHIISSINIQHRAQQSLHWNKLPEVITQNFQNPGVKFPRN